LSEFDLAKASPNAVFMDYCQKDQLAFQRSPSGKAINANAPAQFNLSGDGAGSKGQLAPGYEDIFNAAQQRIGSRKTSSKASDLDNLLDKNGGKTSKTKARNSSIVKALKNL
jgi:hypothetical protein